jgi:O-antigen ligase
MGKKNKAAQKKAEVTADKPVTKNKKNAASNAGPSSMTNWLVVLVAILPFLISSKQIDPAVVNRFIWMACIVLIFTIVFLIRGNRTLPAQFPLPLKLVFISGGAFALWSIISSMNAVNPTEGFYVVSRQLLNLAVLFVIVFVVIHEEKQFLKIAKTLAIAGILHSFIGIFQFYEAAFTDIPGNYLPYGLMANRNLYGSAQALLIPFCLLVLQQGSRTWKYISGASLLLLVISIFFSQTRSAWLASVLIFAVSFILIYIFSPANRKKWLMGSGAGLLIIIFIIGFLVTTNNNEDFKRSIAGRAASFTGSSVDSSAEQKNVTERFTIWKKTIQLIKKEPVLGVGPGNWRIAIPTTGTEGTAWETGAYVPDQPHNDYLHIASETGIPGALLYFIPWIIIGLLGLQVIIKTTSDESRLLTIFMIAGMTAFAADSMFSFPEERIEHSFYFTLMCGAVLGAWFNFQATERNKSISIPKWATYSMVAASAFAIFIGIKRYNFEVHLNRAMAYEKSGQYATVLEEAEAAKNSFITLDPVAKSVEIYSSIGYQKTGRPDKAIKELNIAKKYHPNNYMIYNNLGTIYTDNKEYDKAIENYLKTLQLTPKFENTYKNLAVNYFELMKYKECIDALEKVKWQSDQYLTSLYNDAKRLMNVSQQQIPPPAN